MRWTSASLLLALGTFPAVACGGGSASGDGPSTATQVSVTNQGSGATNSAPLWPLRAGTVVPGASLFGTSYGVGSPVILREPTVQGGMPVWSLSPSGATSVYGDTTRWSMFLTSTSEGLLYLGNQVAGFMPHAALWVPAVVRDGLAWNTDAGNGRSWSCTAKALPARHWKVQCDEQNHKRGPITFTSELVEGEGPADAIVLPLEDMPGTAPVAPVALHPIGSGAPLSEMTFVGESIEALESPQLRGGALELLVGGESAGSQLAGPGDPGNPGATVQATANRATSCWILDGQTITPAATADCRGGGTSWVLPDGKVVAQSDVCPNPLLACGSPQYYAVSHLTGANGEPKLFLGGLTSGEITDYLIGDPIYPVRPGLDELFKNPVHLGDVRINSAGDTNNLVGAMAAFDSSGGVAMGFYQGDHLRTAYFSTGLTTPTFAGAVMTRGRPAILRYGMSLHASPGKRDTIETLPDGKVARIHLTQDGITLETIATVQLAPRQFLIGAVEYKGKLVVLTQRDFLGFEAQYTEPNDIFPTGDTDTSIAPDMGKLEAWTVDIAPSGMPSLPPSRRQVRFQHAGPDIKVCWAGGGAAIAQGWVVGSSSSPVTAVADGDGCVLLMTDRANPPVMPPAVIDRVEGPVPGIGRVRVRIDDGEANRSMPVQPAALATGGFVSPMYTYDRGGLIEGVVRLEGPGFAGVNDSSGHGVWTWGHFCDAKGCGPVLLDPLPHPHHALSWDESVSPMSESVFGGGVILPPTTGRPGGYVLRPDDTIQGLPVPMLAAASTPQPLALLADGTTCGVSDLAGNQVYVQPMSGPVKTATAPGGYPLWASMLAADGRLYSQARDLWNLVAFDPQTITVNAVNLSALGIQSDQLGAHMWGLAHDATGALWMTAGGQFLVRFDKGGPTKIDVPEMAKQPLGNYDVQLLVDPELFLFFITDAQAKKIGAPTTLVRVLRNGR